MAPRSERPNKVGGNISLFPDDNRRPNRSSAALGPIRGKDASKPPTLTRRRLAGRMRRLRPQFPAELVQAAAGEIIAALSSALARGRPVILRGFGRFQVRRYRDSAKRLGVIFRPSPELAARLNRKSEP